jgi:hypothetical protein
VQPDIQNTKNLSSKKVTLSPEKGKCLTTIESVENAASILGSLLRTWHGAKQKKQNKKDYILDT